MRRHRRTCLAATSPKSLRPHVKAVATSAVKLDPEKMPEALKDGTVNEAAITRAAGRVLYEIVHFGYMDGQSKARRHAAGHRGQRQNHRKDRRRCRRAAKNEGGAFR